MEVEGIEGLKGLVGKPIGPSEWREVTQEDIDDFADSRGDDQWIHVDVERAKNESPFGTTIAHGNLTLSLIDGMRLEPDPAPAASSSASTTAGTRSASRRPCPPARGSAPPPR